MSTTSSTESKQLLHRDVCWPDPDPSRSGVVLVDDVTGLNATPVGRIIMAQCPDDIAHSLALARHAHVAVSIRGTQHSMGGHSIAPRGVVIDLKMFNTVEFQPDTTTVRVAAGALWTDVINVLNAEGYSARTMQSYSSFSVGGSLAVNGHGITTDFCMIEAVLSFDLMKYDGSVITCSRDSEDSEARELFSLCIGGYGLFGVIMYITMKVSPNTTLDQEALTMSMADFAEIYPNVQKDTEVDIKLARIDITTMDTITLYLFRRTHSENVRTVSHLAPEPREMGFLQRMMYKWLAPSMKELRFGVEQATGLALDWSQAPDRNTLMYESAVPLARLSSPYLDVDDTFILQEYFVPTSRFCSWVKSTRSIYFDAAKEIDVTILNTTVRFVHYDADCFLKYASAKEGMFAFVIYYRIRRTAEADDKLHTIHTRFVKETLRLGGTFYLPYRHHYTVEEMLQAYPQMSDFIGLKQKYDPAFLFDSAWFQAYCWELCTAEYRKFGELRAERYPEQAARIKSALWANPTKENKKSNNSIAHVSQRRDNSYRTMYKTTAQRRAFVQLFLTRVFNVQSNVRLHQLILQSLYMVGDGASDDDIYTELTRQLASSSSALSNAIKTYKSLFQLQSQKREFTLETLRLLHKIGRVGSVKDYISIGDHGKMVMAFRTSLGVTGNVWVVNDVNGADDVLAAVERGNADEVGTFVPIDYTDARFAEIPSDSADLVTMNQGLHHIPQENLSVFLGEVQRVLRDGGCFIVREHDATDDLIPMLDVAHSVFNAVTGVEARVDRREIRAFRTIANWRSVVEGTTSLVDTRVYEMQSDDPTRDVMMCFVKNPHLDENVLLEQHPEPATTTTTGSKSESAGVSTAEAIVTVSTQTIDGLIEFLGGVRSFAVSSSPDPTIADSLVSGPITTGISMLQRLRPMIANAVAAHGGVGGVPEMDSLVPADLFQGFIALERRVKSGAATSNEVFVHSILDKLRKAIEDDGSVSEEDTSSDGAVLGPDDLIDDNTSQNPVMANVRAELQALVADLPELADPSFWLTVGVTRQMQGLVATRGGVTMDDVAKWLVSKLDGKAWSDVREALKKIRAQRLLPHMELVMNQRDAGNAWWSLATSALGSKRLSLTQSARWYASLNGLQDFVSLFDASQEAREQNDFLVRQDSTTPENLRSTLVDALNALQGRQKEVVFEGKDLRDIHDVSKVVRVEHRGKNVTEFVCDKYLRGDTLYLCGVNLDAEMRYTSFTNTRTVQWLTGKAVIRVVYYSSSPNDAGDTLPIVHRALNSLTLMGHRRLKPRTRASNTFYKLAEWMQVEICKTFAQSLDSSPWYRYPYMQVLRTYFQVLRNEAAAVQKREGFLRTFLSSSFATSFVPGLVMGLHFMQMQIMALPVRHKFSDQYGSTSSMTEKIIFTVADNDKIPVNELTAIFNGSPPVQLCDRVFMVTSPVFKAFTECLTCLAAVPSLHILDISGQDIIQTKIAVTREQHQAVMQTIDRFPTAHVVTSYEYPAMALGVDGQTNVALDGDIFVGVSLAPAHLASFIRTINKARGVRLIQVFDYWV